MAGKGIRTCSFASPAAEDHVHHVHHYTSPQREAAARSADNTRKAASVTNAEREVFSRTLAFYCALRKHGCAVLDDPDWCDHPYEEEEDAVPRDVRSKTRPTCSGKIVMQRDPHGHSYLQCVRARRRERL